MLEARNLRRSYGAFLAVDDVSFSIGKGEIVGLLGPNGAGKTTIMKMLSGYLEPNGGHISIDGRNFTRSRGEIQQSLGYLPENLPVYPEMSVADYLDYAAELKNLTGARKRTEVARAVKATSICKQLLHPIATLSRGYKQRVGVAQALLGKPSLLILDEPTNGLDPTQTEHMRALIREIARDATVILSTHIMQEVDAVCDRVLILNRGKLAVDARLQDLRRSNRLFLSTSMPPDCAEALRERPGVQSLEVLPGDGGNVCSYRLALEDAHALRGFASDLARAIIEAGFELYQLQPEHRDLETVFREANSPAAARTGKETVSHAA